MYPGLAKLVMKTAWFYTINENYVFGWWNGVSNNESEWKSNAKEKKLVPMIEMNLDIY